MIKLTIWNDRVEPQMIELTFCNYQVGLSEWSNRTSKVNDSTLYDDQADPLRCSSRPSVIMKSTILVWPSRNGQLDLLESCPIVDLWNSQSDPPDYTKFIYLIWFLYVELPAVFTWLGPVRFRFISNIEIKVKRMFYQRHFDHQNNYNRELQAIPQNELKHAFESLLNRCNKCIETGGKYFE